MTIKPRCFYTTLDAPQQRKRTSLTSTRVMYCLRHRAVDAFFKDTMKKTAEHPHCLTAGTAPGLMDNFKKNNEVLEGIAKGLDTFLEVGPAFEQLPTSWRMHQDLSMLSSLASASLSTRASSHTNLRQPHPCNWKVRQETTYRRR